MTRHIGYAIWSDDPLLTIEEALKAKRVTMESIEVEAASVDEAQERIESILTNEYKEGWVLVNIGSEVPGIGVLPVIASRLLRGARRRIRV
jgi:hypothetical protein